MLAYLGNGLYQSRQHRREERVAHDSKVGEVVAAADDLRQRVRLFGSTWALGSGKGTAVGIEVGRAARELPPGLRAEALALPHGVGADDSVGAGSRRDYREAREHCRNHVPPRL